MGRACYVSSSPRGRVASRGLDVLCSALRDAALRRMQIVFQDPFSSLNPRMTVGSSVREGMRIHGIADGAEADKRVRGLFEEVGLNPGYASRYPHEFSGGQRQRIGIARALAVEPDLIVCDEPVSALDVSVQAQVVNLLSDLQRDRGLAYLFIAHDLSVVEHVADRVAVMYLGRIVEIGAAQRLYSDPIMPYTQALLSAVPSPSAENRAESCSRRPTVAGTPAAGCVFFPRCRILQRTRSVRALIPPLEEKTPAHFAACIKQPDRRLAEQAVGAPHKRRAGPHPQPTVAEHDQQDATAWQRGGVRAQAATVTPPTPPTWARQVDATPPWADSHFFGHPRGTSDAVPHRDVGALLVLRNSAAAGAVHDIGAHVRRVRIRPHGGELDRRHLCRVGVSRVAPGRLGRGSLAGASASIWLGRSSDRTGAPRDRAVRCSRSQAPFFSGSFSLSSGPGCSSRTCRRSLAVSIRRVARGETRPSRSFTWASTPARWSGRSSPVTWVSRSVGTGASGPLAWEWSWA